MRPKTSINKTSHSSSEKKKKEKKKHLDVKPCLSYAKVCSKHSLVPAPKWGTFEVFEHKMYVPLQPEIPRNWRIMKHFGSFKTSGFKRYFLVLL